MTLGTHAWAPDTSKIHLRGKLFLMRYHVKPQKRSKIAVLLGVGTIGIGVWVTAYLAYFQDTPPLVVVPMQNQQASQPPSRYEGTSFSGHYLAGRFAQQQQALDQSASFMMRAIRLQKGNLDLMQEALRSLVAAGQMPAAAGLASNMIKKDTVDPMAALIRICYLVQQGEYKEAAQLVDKPANIGVYAVIKPTIAQWLQIGLAMPKDPIVMQEVLDRSGFLAPFIHYQLALMNDLAGQSDIALKHYSQALSNPQLMPYRVVQAVSNFYLRQGNKAKAQKVYDDYAKQNPSSELIPDHLPQGNLAVEAIVPMVETPGQGLAEILFTTASLLFGEQATTEAMVYLQMALYLRPDFPPAQLMLANLHEQMKNHKAAIETYQAIDPATVFYKRGRLRTALNYQAMGDHQKAVGLLTQLEAEYPNDPEPSLTLGDLFRTQKDFKQAAHFYSQAIERDKQINEEDWVVFYSRGVAYERAGEWPKAEADFKQALYLSPDQPDVLNYLGYSWLVKNQNLIRASSYIEQALEQRPSDAHIIDSMGWAFYLMGNFKDALVYMEQAAELTPQDATINDHLGDVYWRLGRRIEARFQWERALEFEPEDPAAIKLKIEAGLPEFQAPTEAALGKTEEPVAAIEKGAGTEDAGTSSKSKTE